MSTINASLPSLLDHVKRMDPDGSIAPIVESLSKDNRLIGDAVFAEGNEATGHVFTSRTALPSVSWVRINEGVTPSKSRTGQTRENAGRLKGMSVVDVEEANLNGNEAAFRASEDMAFVAALQNEVETGMFYHSTSSAPEKFNGLSPRLNSTTGTAGSQIIKCDAAASGSDQTSIWIIGWGLQSVFGFFPKGMVGGLQPYDMGQQLWDDGTGKKFRAYVTDWTWRVGLCVKDYRYLVRIANIDTGSLDGTADTLIPALIDGVGQMKDTTSVRPVIYCNRKINTFLRKQARNATKNSTLSIEMVGGKPVTTFDGIPIHVSDAILNTEAVVS